MSRATTVLPDTGRAPDPASGELTYSPRQVAAQAGADPDARAGTAPPPRPGMTIIDRKPLDFRIEHIGVGQFGQGTIVNEAEFPFNTDIDRLVALGAISPIGHNGLAMSQQEIPEDLSGAAATARRTNDLLEMMVENLRTLNGNLQGVDMNKLRELSEAQTTANAAS